jgi:integrase
MRTKITKRVVEDLTEPGWLWDTGVPGFGVRLQHAQGHRRYVLHFTRHRRSRWLTIGVHGAPWIPETARDEARRLLGELAAGKDPAQVRDRRRTGATLRGFAERYLREYAEPHKKPATVAGDRQLLGLAKPGKRKAARGRRRRTILEALGAVPLTEVSRADVTRLHLAWRDTPIRANRALALLSSMFNLAEKWGLRPDGSNPCRHVDRFAERRRKRYLSAQELARVGAALAQLEEKGLPSTEDTKKPRPAPWAAAALRLLILTGARTSEVLTLRWEHVDLDAGVLRLPDSKTGAKDVYLPAPAVQLLASLPQLERTPYVFPGRAGKTHLSELGNAWERVRAVAALPDVRPHDLRHSFAAVAAGAGSSLLLIGGLLGHTQPATTARYAHLSADPLRAAADQVGKRIAAALQGDRKDGEGAEVRAFAKGKSA